MPFYTHGVWTFTLKANVYYFCSDSPEFRRVHENVPCMLLMESTEQYIG